MKTVRSKNFTKKLQEFLKKTTIILSVFVVFLSSYLLVLPAVTLDKDAGVEEPGIEIETSETSENTENEDLVYIYTSDETESDPDMRSVDQIDEERSSQNQMIETNEELVENNMQDNVDDVQENRE